MNHESWHHILGIPPNATPEDIKAAYRRLAFKYHPDRNQGSKVAEEKFKRIIHAYEMLTKPSEIDLGNEEDVQTTYESPSDLVRLFQKIEFIWICGFFYFFWCFWFGARYYLCQEGVDSYRTMWWLTLKKLQYSSIPYGYITLGFVVMTSLQLSALLFWISIIAWFLIPYCLSNRFRQVLDLADWYE
jgi:hypothetical protein